MQVAAWRAWLWGAARKNRDLVRTGEPARYTRVAARRAWANITAQPRKSGHIAGGIDRDQVKRDPVGQHDLQHRQSPGGKHCRADIAETTEMKGRAGH